MPSGMLADRTRITRSLSRSLSRTGTGVAPSPDASEYRRSTRRMLNEDRTTPGEAKPISTTAPRGILRCRCDRYLLSPQDQLVECIRCFNWCHLLCSGIDPKTLHIVKKSFVCDFCKADEVDEVVGSKRPRSSVSGSDLPISPSAESDGKGRKSSSVVVKAHQPPPRQTAVKLTEIKDSPPSDMLQLASLSVSLRQLAESLGFDLVEFGGGRPTSLTDELIEQCMECCSSSIADATFSDSYPRYCMRELQQQHHHYLQASLIRCKATSRVVSLVFSNGMDPYGNLKSTIAQLKRTLTRASSGATTASETALAELGDFAAQCLAISDVSDFVHITLTATHSEFRNRGLAKISMLNELVRWLQRGRNRAFLNMALEKRVVAVPSTASTTTAAVTCAPPLASRNLYTLFGFHDVFPRVVKDTGEFRWTAQEADMGRVMANLSVRKSALSVANDLLERFKARKELDAHVEAVHGGTGQQMRLRRRNA